ncbi:unnamed protein product [marine sediment metagenome]|uniref:Uncharacterized protein n=1 Tax=marine sediment metagenome TaxID=412755 RepID=X0YMX1_9ZZZZ
MAQVDASPFEDARWYVWADTAASAKAQVTAHLRRHGLEVSHLQAVRTGLVRPMGYEYSRKQIRTGQRINGKDVTVEADALEGTDLLGREIGGGRESSDKDMARWRVDLAA